jgi:hypothetical protein
MQCPILVLDLTQNRNVPPPALKLPNIKLHQTPLNGFVLLHTRRRKDRHGTAKSRSLVIPLRQTPKMSPGNTKKNRKN